MKHFQIVAFGIALGLVALIGSARTASAVPQHPVVVVAACPECGPVPLCDPNDPKCSISDR